jgi:hypothetical protein
MLAVCIVSTTSCVTPKESAYKRVKASVTRFDDAIEYMIAHGYHGSFSKPLAYERASFSEGDLLETFMREQKLLTIHVWGGPSYSDEPCWKMDSLIVFTYRYNYFLANRRRVVYDLSQSKSYSKNRENCAVKPRPIKSDVYWIK